MSKNVTLWGASYSNVPAINVPQTGGGTARFTDTSPTTAVDSDVASGKIYFKADGSQSTGTGEGGGGSSMRVGVISTPSTIVAGMLIYEGLQGTPTSFVVEYTGSTAISPSASQETIVTAVYDGEDTWGQKITNTANAQVSYTDNIYHNYADGTLEIILLGSGTDFDSSGQYSLTYTYGGNSSNIGTEQVQVGSGATSITFTGLTDEPNYFSCGFLGNFSTSSGYQRVISVVYDGQSTYGLEMDSGAHYNTSHWSYTYSNGSLTISSQGTNAGGYFHQPSSYQLTYGIGGDQSMQTKTVTPTTSTQNVTPDAGYTGLSKVVVNPIPSEYIIPTGNLAITQNGNNINVSQYATVSVNVGGGSSLNTQVAQSTTRSTSTSYTEVIALTCAVAGTYDVYWSTFRSSTSGTWGSQLYVNDEAYGTAQTGSWSNHIQNIHLTSVSLSKNDDVAVRVRSRGSNYYGYVGTLTIKQTS